MRTYCRYKAVEGPFWLLSKYIVISHEMSGRGQRKSSVVCLTHRWATTMAQPFLPAIAAHLRASSAIICAECLPKLRWRSWALCNWGIGVYSWMYRTFIYCTNHKIMRATIQKNNLLQKPVFNVLYQPAKSQPKASVVYTFIEQDIWKPEILMGLLSDSFQIPDTIWLTSRLLLPS